jgi:hypothetical protein
MVGSETRVFWQTFTVHIPTILIIFRLFSLYDGYNVKYIAFYHVYRLLKVEFDARHNGAENRSPSADARLGPGAWWASREIPTNRQTIK